tara:strand:- start:29704 stop:30681 length:978 start_codon:yes stop_codon:yes gene_type:complete
MKKIILISLLIGLSTSVFADNLSKSRVDSHGPISLMADHNHNKNEIMTSYRFMSMAMDGNIQGNNDITTTAITGGSYMMAPETMSMSMHMIGMMYGVSNHTTLMMMTSYQEKEMSMINRMNQPSSSKTNGLSDLKLSALQTILKSDKQSWIANIGLSLPIGSIDEANSGSRLPYAMQLGSGTTDFMLGTTYIGYTKYLSYGSQIASVIRTGKNKNQYRLGNNLSLSTWVAKAINSNLSLSARLTRSTQSDITGSDTTLTMMSPTTSTNTGNISYTASIGSNIQFTKKPLAGARLAFEISKPVLQHAKGIQMKKDYNYTVGYQQLF